jgi:N-acetylglucosamine kinase-like BadF-type ATPase
MPTYLLVDAGQTGTRMRFVPGTGQEFDVAAAGVPAAADAERHLAQVVAGELERHGAPVDAVAAGLTGLHGAPGHPGTLLHEWSMFGVHRVLLADDSVTGYLAAIGLQPGVVLSVGTGVVVLATAGHGGWARADGWGHLLGDLGGGYWIGRAGLEAALRSLDGRSMATTAILDVAAEQFGVPAALPRMLHRDPDRVRKIADFAQPVLALAARHDPVAERICLDAARHLADAAVAAARRAGLAADTIAVSWSGSLLGGSPLLADALRTSLAGMDPRYVLAPPAGAPLDGARLLINLPPDHPLNALTVKASTTTEAQS